MPRRVLRTFTDDMTAPCRVPERDCGGSGDGWGGCLEVWDRPWRCGRPQPLVARRTSVAASGLPIVACSSPVLQVPQGVARIGGAPYYAVFPFIAHGFKAALFRVCRLLLVAIGSRFMGLPVAGDVRAVNRDHCGLTTG